MNKKWEVINNKIIYNRGLVQFKEKLCHHPEKEIKHRFFRLEFPDWVNIVPVTTNKEVVLVKQYRFGTEEFTLEVPGGMIEEGEAEPEEAARRELLEETGYYSEKLEFLGKTAVNPAIQDNFCYFYLAQRAEQIQGQNLDQTEEIEIKLVPIDKIKEMISSGRISHSLTVLALLYTQEFY